MVKAVNINDLVDAFDLQSAFLVFFLDKNTGEVIPLTGEEIDAIEKGEAVGELGFAKEVISSDQFVELPELNKKALIEEFCSFIEDAEMQKALLQGVEEEEAFTMFNTKVHFYQLEEDWFAFVQDRLAEMAIDWCKQNSISYIDVPREEKADWL